MWFWDKLQGIAPQAVQRFSDGLDRHWVTDARSIYNRHAGITRTMRHDYSRVSPRSCDFARHSGLYIVDLAYAYRSQPRPDTLEQIHRYAGHWWARFTPGECLLHESVNPAQTAGEPGELAPAQTLSLAASLLEAADLLEEREAALAAEFRRRANSYADAFLAAPHQPELGIFVAAYQAGTRKLIRLNPVAASIYGLLPVASQALICCAMHRLTGRTDLLDWAKAAATACAAEMLAASVPSSPQPDSHRPGSAERPAELEGLFTNNGVISSSDIVPAMDAGLALELLADLFDITRAPHWLETATTLWSEIHRRYFHNGLIRLCADGAWYEAQQGSAYLLHGAARLGVVSDPSLAGSVAPDYTAR